MIDTHAHLDLDEADDILDRAAAVGVDCVIAVATTIAGAEEAVELARRHPDVYASLGVHPHEAAGPDASRLDELRVLLADDRAVAVGETGLDYYRDYAPPEAQRRLFEAQLELATELELPVVVHTRAADADTLAVLAGFAGAVILHCFSSPELLPAALERGWYVSFAGNVTYPNAIDLRAAARLVPAERILAETDSPYLAPQAVRGRRNEPAYVVHTLEALAKVRDEEPATLAAQIDANATAVFSL